MVENQWPNLWKIISTSTIFNKYIKCNSGRQLLAKESVTPFSHNPFKGTYKRRVKRVDRVETKFADYVKQAIADQAKIIDPAVPVFNSMLFVQPSHVIWENITLNCIKVAK